MAIEYRPAGSPKLASVKTAIEPSGKAMEALARVEEVAAEKRDPTKPLSGKTKTLTIRLDEDVIEAWKKNAAKPTSMMASLITYHALDKGWL